MRATGPESVSAQRVLALTRERSPWEITITEGSSVAGLKPRTFQWAVKVLKDAGLIDAVATKGNKTTLLDLQTPTGQTPTQRDAQREVDPRNESRNEIETRATNGATCATTHCAPLARSFETTNDLEASSFVSSQILTTNEVSEVVEQTARGPRNVRNESRNESRNELSGFFRLALDRAEELGRVKAENAHLRERLARLETTCTTPAPLPTPSTSAPPAGTRGSATTSPATGPTSGPPLSSTSSGSTWTPTVTPTAPGIEPRPSAPPSPPVAPPHPANRRDDPLPPAPGADDAEDQRLFLELAKEHGLSEQAAEAELIRAWSIGRPLHEAIASVWLIRESGGELEAPWAYLWSVLARSNKYPTPEGVASRWSEIRGPWLAVAKARNKKREAKAAKAEAKAAADYPMNLDRPLVRQISEKAKAEGW